ncbi:MAG: UTRA domain-containing protein, partial [Nocardioidaceae bacterium]
SILGVDSGAALLSITRTTKNADGRTFEFSSDLFRADRTVITVRTPASVREQDGAGEHGRVVQTRPRSRR